MTKSIDSSGIRADVDGAIARITLDRPAQHNAVHADDIDDFRACLDEFENDDVIRVIVITGSGDTTFCSGASLAQMESGEMSGAVFETLTNRLSDVRLPTICALNGSVYGGGAEIALCCDFRIGLIEGRLSVPAAKLGVCYPVGGLRRYVDRLGLPTASRILLAAEEMDSAELLRVGFLTHRVSSEKLVAETQVLATQLAALAPLAVQSMKRILIDVAAGTVDAAEATRLVRLCAESEDLREGLRARREKREPRFEGR